MSALADPKTTVEATAMKTIALEHLGTIGARVRHDFPDRSKGLKTLQDVSHLIRVLITNLDRSQQVVAIL